MAARKSASEPVVEGQEGEEPEREVDPPEATAADTTDVEQGTTLEWVRLNQAVIASLPSGASYAFSAGEVRKLKPEDVEYVIEQGYGTRTDTPSEA
jgi:hypothetical protein